MLISGIFFVYMSAAPVWMGLKSKDWKPTVGTLVSFQKKSRTKYGYGINIGLRYEYEIAGKHYTGTSYSPGGFRNVVSYYEYEDLNNKVGQYQAITLYFNQNDPSQSCLIAGKVPGSDVVYLIFFGLALISVLFKLVWISYHNDDEVSDRLTQ